MCGSWENGRGTSDDAASLQLNQDAGVDLPSRQVIGHGVLLVGHVRHPVVRADVGDVEEVEAIHAEPDVAEVADEYRLANMTYLLPTDAAFTDEDDGYFAHHQFSYIDELTGDTVSYAPITMTAYPKEEVKEFLLYHIVKGPYTFTNLPAEPTWFETEAVADTAKVNMYLLKDRNPNITFNDFEGHYLNEIKPRTSNLFNSDGSYMHVLDNWLDRPTREQLTGFEE